MGGMNAWQWAEAYPDMMDGVMPVVSVPMTVSGRNLLWRRIVIDTIRSDPDWKGGDYTQPPKGWVDGFRMLRLMIDSAPNLQRQLPDSAAVDQFFATRLFALNFSDDEFNPDKLQVLERVVPRLKQGRYFVQDGTASSPGHYTMTRPDLWASHVGDFMQWLGDAPAQPTK